MFAADLKVRATCDADSLIGVLKFVVVLPYRSVASRLRVAVHSREQGLALENLGKAKCLQSNEAIGLSRGFRARSVPYVSALSSSKHGGFGFIRWIFPFRDFAAWGVDSLLVPSLSFSSCPVGYPV